MTYIDSRSGRFNGWRDRRKAGVNCPECGHPMVVSIAVTECPSCHHVIAKPTSFRERRQGLNVTVENVHESIRAALPETHGPEPQFAALESPPEMGIERKLLTMALAMGALLILLETYDTSSQPAVIPKPHGLEWTSIVFAVIATAVIVTANWPAPRLKRFVGGFALANAIVVPFLPFFIGEAFDDFYTWSQNRYSAGGDGAAIVAVIVAFCVWAVSFLWREAQLMDNRP
jgi:hypothetical protein